VANSSDQNDFPSKHLFICTNTRENGESCGAKGAVELRDSVKKACKATNPFPNQKFRVNAAGCLGVCERGIAAVLYPEGNWLVDLESGDTNKVLEFLRERPSSPT
jgi:predicted metal-binding protein